MVDFLRILNQTPIPTILIVGGILFLFLALGGQLGAKLVTHKVNRKAAGLVGGVFLVIGLILFIIPIPNPDDRDRHQPGDPEEIQLILEDLEREISRNDEHQNRAREEIERLERELNRDPHAAAAIRDQKELLFTLEDERRRLEKKFNSLEREKANRENQRDP